jgi:acyl carrier protein
LRLALSKSSALLELDMLDRVDLADSLIRLSRPLAPGLPESDDFARRAPLSDAGLTSMDAVRLMLAIEAEFALAIPDAELTPENFASIETIKAMIERLRAD